MKPFELAQDTTREGCHSAQEGRHNYVPALLRVQSHAMVGYCGLNPHEYPVSPPVFSNEIGPQTRNHPNLHNGPREARYSDIGDE